MNKDHLHYIIPVIFIVTAIGLAIFAWTRVYILRNVDVPIDARDMITVPANTGHGSGQVLNTIPVDVPPPKIQKVSPFRSMNNPESQNIVGYLSYGAFVIYVPDWIVDHWDINSSKDGSAVIITPLDQSSTRNFSDIVMTIRPTDEGYNAEWLYEQDRRYVSKDATLNDSILFNETRDMTIYQIERIMKDEFTETYYLNGNSKTAEIRFSAMNTDYLEFAPKIREFVESLGKGSLEG